MFQRDSEGKGVFRFGKGGAFQNLAHDRDAFAALRGAAEAPVHLRHRAAAGIGVAPNLLIRETVAQADIHSRRPSLETGPAASSLEPKGS